MYLQLLVVCSGEHVESVFHSLLVTLLISCVFFGLKSTQTHSSLECLINCQCCFLIFHSGPAELVNMSQCLQMLNKIGLRKGRRDWSSSNIFILLVLFASIIRCHYLLVLYSRLISFDFRDFDTTVGLSTDMSRQICIFLSFVLI